MKLVFDDRAIADLESIFDWIARDSPATAKAVVERLFKSIELLILFPSVMSVMPPGRLNGWRPDCLIS